MGDYITRSELAVDYGGHVRYGGIVRSKVRDTVLVFTDPEKGRKHGYLYDGFSPDGSVFHYTGAGETGDQTPNNTNSSLISAADSGRLVQVFLAAGRISRTQTVRQQYVGDFIVDPGTPFERRPSVGADKKARTVIVFRLLPVSVVPAAVRDAVGTIDTFESLNAVEVPAELNSTQFFEVAESAARTAVRRESTLVEEFIAYRHGHEFTRWAISIPGERSPLLTDIYDKSDRVLYEAKAVSGRSEARMAVGQLYDYRRHIEVDGLACALLMPDRPTADLRDFVASAGLGLAYRDGERFKLEEP